MKPAKLSPSSVKLIQKALEDLFIKIKERVIGDKYPAGKHLYIKYDPYLTLRGIFDLAAHEEGVTPKDDIFKPLRDIAVSYLDAVKEKSKAKFVQGIQAFLHDASIKGVKTNVSTVLGGKLAEMHGELTRDVKRILDTESTTVRNVSIMDGIVKANAAAGIEDPNVFWIPVRDSALCDECRRLHLLPDGITPKIYKMSEAGSGYHKKGDVFPKISGLHPHCRCILTTLMPGYGFDSAGRITYKSPGYDEFKNQRG